MVAIIINCGRDGVLLLTIDPPGMFQVLCPVLAYLLMVLSYNSIGFQFGR